MFRWFHNQNDFMRAIQGMETYRIAAETWIETHKAIPGYCVSCKKITQLQVKVGGYYGTHANLREGMTCANCQISNRGRLLYQAIAEASLDIQAPNIAILERMSSLFGGLQQVFPSIIGSEYLGEDKVPGATYNWQGFEVRHESITEMSFQPESLDFIAHSDVLEHVYDYRRALKQAASVLKPEGGTMLCTVPFFMTRVDALELARPHADGSIEYFVAPEYHGDGLRPEGILTWHHFGWELLQDAIDAGFSSASIGIDYDPFCGFTTNNHPSADYGLMYPLVFRAQR